MKTYHFRKMIVAAAVLLAMPAMALAQLAPTVVAHPGYTSTLILPTGCYPSKVSAPDWTLHNIRVGNEPELEITPDRAGLHTKVVVPLRCAGEPTQQIVVTLIYDSAK